MDDQDIKMKDEYWKILNHGYTLPEALAVLKMYDGDMIGEIKLADTHDSFNYFCASLMIAYTAYRRLVKMGEIDGNKIFSMSNGSPVNGDVGFTKDDVFRFTDKWMSITNHRPHQ